MTNYVLEDEFEFVTDDSGLVIRTRPSCSDSYQREKDLGIYVIGSVPTLEADLGDTTKISNTPQLGEYMVVNNNLRGRSTSPTRITSITDNRQNLVKRVMNYVLRR